MSGASPAVRFQVHGGAGDQFVQQAERNVEPLRRVANGKKNRVVRRSTLQRPGATRPATASSRRRRSSREMLSSSDRSSALRMKA